ncbi:MAG: hypothetical protein AAF226_02215 [Verrucomicrobiota bacterium]
MTETNLFEIKLTGKQLTALSHHLAVAQQQQADYNDRQLAGENYQEQHGKKLMDAAAAALAEVEALIDYIEETVTNGTKGEAQKCG